MIANIVENTALSTDVDLAVAAEWTLADIAGADAVSVAAAEDLSLAVADQGLLDRKASTVPSGTPVRNSDAGARATSSCHVRLVGMSGLSTLWRPSTGR